MADDSNVVPFPSKEEKPVGLVMSCPDCKTKTFRIERESFDTQEVHVYCSACEGYLGPVTVSD